MSHATENRGNDTKLIKRIAPLVFIGFSVWVGVFAPFDLSQFEQGLFGGFAATFAILAVNSFIDYR